MYAVIATGGKQYKVSEGDVIRVEKLGAEADSKFTFDQVLLSFTSIREKQVIIKRMVIDSSIQKLRLIKSMLNQVML